MYDDKVYNARRRLLYQALELAGLEVGPEDETVSATYHASLEYAEEELDRAVDEYVSARDYHSYG